MNCISCCLAVLQVTNLLEPNFPFHASMYDGKTWRVVIGNWGNFLQTEHKQVLLLHPHHLVHDAQKDNPAARGAVFNLTSVLQALLDNKPLQPLHYNSYRDNDVEMSWRSVQLKDGKAACLVVPLAALLTGMLPLHPVISKRVTGHTVAVGSGGVFTTGIAAVQLRPSVSVAGSPIVGDSMGVVEAAAAEILSLIVTQRLHDTSPINLLSVLRCSIRAGLDGTGLPDRQPPPDCVLVCCISQLQLQARLLLDDEQSAAQGPEQQQQEHGQPVSAEQQATGSNAAAAKDVKDVLTTQKPWDTMCAWLQTRFYRSLQD